MSIIEHTDDNERFAFWVAYVDALDAARFNQGLTL